MQVTESKQSANYLTFYKGDLVQEFDEAPSNPEFTVHERTKSTGRKVFYYKFDDLTGMLVDPRVMYRNIGGNEILMVSLGIENPDGSRSVISTAFDNSNGKHIAFKFGSIDPTIPLTIDPYDFTPQNSKRKVGLNFVQNGVKLPYCIVYDSLPQPIQYMDMGKQKYDYREHNNELYAIFTSHVDRVRSFLGLPLMAELQQQEYSSRNQNNNNNNNQGGWGGNNNPPNNNQGWGGNQNPQNNPPNNNQGWGGNNNLPNNNQGWGGNQNPQNNLPNNNQGWGGNQNPPNNNQGWGGNQNPQNNLPNNNQGWGGNQNPPNNNQGWGGNQNPQNNLPNNNQGWGGNQNPPNNNQGGGYTPNPADRRFQNNNNPSGPPQSTNANPPNNNNQSGPPVVHEGQFSNQVPPTEFGDMGLNDDIPF
jgi:hypothetical protein